MSENNELVCMRCCKPVGQKEQFFMTNCCHLICSPCVKYCIVNSPADSNGHYTIICLVERKPRKIIPLQRLPPEGRSLFKDVTIVSESFYSCYVMLVPSCSLSVSVSQKNKMCMQQPSRMMVSVMPIRARNLHKLQRI